MHFVPLVIAMLVAGGISGMTGFGVGVVGSISLAILVGPKAAVILLSILSSFASGAQVVKFRRELPVVRRLMWLLAAALVGAIAGSYLLLRLSYTVLATLLGAFTLVYVVISLIGLRPRVSERAERLLSPVVGLVAGVVNSTVGSSGPVLGPYMLALGLTPAAFIISLSSTFFVMGVVRMVTLAALDVYTWPVVAAGFGLLVPTFCGQLAGFWLQSRVPRHVFERLVLALLAVAASYLVYRGVLSAL
ncbi:MAG TPA: sulfite exporter TauE/SafE family protein [Chloroflexota bacterium]|nr:sulfite exporter TauE/SafE family protein [Chloroflexota bacterium]